MGSISVWTFSVMKDCKSHSDLVQVSLFSCLISVHFLGYPSNIYFFLSYFIKLNKLKEKMYENNIIVLFYQGQHYCESLWVLYSKSFLQFSILMFLLRLLINFTSIGIFPLVYTMYINRKWHADNIILIRAVMKISSCQIERYK